MAVKYSPECPEIHIAVEKSLLDLTQALERVMHSNFVLRHARTSADVVEGSDQVRCDIWR